MTLLLCLLFLGNPTDSTEPTFVYLVRHAEKQDASKDPELNERGLQRAQELADFFQNNKIDAFFSSQYKRTVATLKPLIKAKHGQLIQVPAQNPEALVEKVLAMKGQTILIAGHSNTLPDLIQRFGGPVVEIKETDYRNLFLLVLVGDQARLQVFQMQP